MTLQKEKYYKFINTVVKIGFDSDDIPEYCDFFDIQEQKFIRKDDLMHEIVNHYEITELDENDFAERLSQLKITPHNHT